MNKLLTSIAAATFALVSAAPALAADGQVLVLERVNRVRAALEGSRANEATKLTQMKTRYQELDAMKQRGEINDDMYHKQRLRLRESYLLARMDFLDRLNDALVQQTTVYKDQREAIEKPMKELENSVASLLQTQASTIEELKNLAQTSELLKTAQRSGITIDSEFLEMVTTTTPIHAENLAFMDAELKSIQDQYKLQKNAHARLKLLETSIQLRQRRVSLQKQITQMAMTVTQILLKFDGPIAVDVPTWLESSKLEAPVVEAMPLTTGGAATNPVTVDPAQVLSSRGVTY